MVGVGAEVAATRVRPGEVVVATVTAARSAATDRAVAIGIDVGGTKTTACTITAAGAVLERTRTPTPRDDPDALLALVTDLAGAFGARVPVGVGIAGTVTPDGRVARAPNLGLRDWKARLTLTERLGVRVTVANDALVALWAEHLLGAARGANHVVMVTVGTGIGGALLVDGRLAWGARGHAAEVGHMLVEADGRRCGCGARGCLEAYASGEAVGIAARRLPAADQRSIVPPGSGVPSTADIHRAATQGNVAARELLAQAGRWLGRGLVSIVQLVDPERIVVGGGLAARAQGFLVGPMTTVLAQGLDQGMGGPAPDVAMAELGDDAGMIGAALLARSRSGT